MVHSNGRPALAGLIASVALGLGLVGPAAAIDRIPSNTGFVSDAIPQYGSASRGYGAERQYSGAENLQRSRWHYGRNHSGPRFRHHGSIYDFGEAPSVGTAGAAGVYPGFGGGSFVYFGERDGQTDEPSLDRTYRTSDGRTVEEIYAGGAKIIRIAAEPSGARSGEASRRAHLEPWSEGWNRYCTRTHRDFDPARGTFTAANGSTRFCTGE